MLNFFNVSVNGSVSVRLQECVWLGVCVITNKQTLTSTNIRIRMKKILWVRAGYTHTRLCVSECVTDIQNLHTRAHQCGH